MPTQCSPARMSQSFLYTHTRSKTNIHILGVHVVEFEQPDAHIMCSVRLGCGDIFLTFDCKLQRQAGCAVRMCRFRCRTSFANSVSQNALLIHASPEDHALQHVFRQSKSTRKPQLCRRSTFIMSRIFRDAIPHAVIASRSHSLNSADSSIRQFFLNGSLWQAKCHERRMHTQRRLRADTYSVLVVFSLQAAASR